ncbi:MAG: helicase [Candidatus Cloacimonadota bacterium]|nr:MAG: helicase [Candidatus Cloacimonadota bacterium]PIE79754.1 MAG: helicase [Candidatus Delongbacteria bacterium]
MQIKIFTISVLDNTQSENDLNKFLRAHKILEVQNQLIQNNNSAHWCFCIKYLENSYNSTINSPKSSSKKIDYKTVLDEKTFELFSKLREIRKAIASEDGVPAYAVFTDEELVSISKLETISKPSLLTIKGIGDKKIERFAERVISRIKD